MTEFETTHFLAWFAVFGVLANMISFCVIAHHSLRTRDMVRRLDLVVLKHLQDGLSHM